MGGSGQILAPATHVPIGPAPNTRTVWPADTPARRQACTPTDIGSTMAPSSSDTLAGSLKQYLAGWLMYLAKLPCTGGVAKNSTSEQRLYWPWQHSRQPPQGTPGSSATSSPTCHAMPCHAVGTGTAPRAQGRSASRKPASTNACAYAESIDASSNGNDHASALMADDLRHAPVKYGLLTAPGVHTYHRCFQDERANGSMGPVVNITCKHDGGDEDAKAHPRCAAHTSTDPKRLHLHPHVTTTQRSWHWILLSQYAMGHNHQRSTAQRYISAHPTNLHVAQDTCLHNQVLFRAKHDSDVPLVLFGMFALVLHHVSENSTKTGSVASAQQQQTQPQHQDHSDSGILSFVAYVNMLMKMSCHVAALQLSTGPTAKATHAGKNNAYFSLA